VGVKRGERKERKVSGGRRSAVKSGSKKVGEAGGTYVMDPPIYERGQDKFKKCQEAF